MSLTDQLRSLGTRLGLVQPAPAVAAGTPAKVATRTITLTELRIEILGERVADLAPATDDDAGLAIPFSIIDETAGVRTPAHGWHAERVAELARRHAQAPRAAMQAAVLAELAQAGAPAEDVVRDALARDQAVDAYAVAAAAALSARIARRRKRCAEIATLMERYQQEMAGLERQDAVDRDRWAAWWATKLARERTLAAAVDALLDHPVVTVDQETPSIG